MKNTVATVIIDKSATINMSVSLTNISIHLYSLCPVCVDCFRILLEILVVCFDLTLI